MKEVKNITIEKKTAERFQEFSRLHFTTHSEALASMLDFFYYNEISPKEKLGPTGRTLEKALKKRMNGIIAIIKDIEKNQTKPTAAMLTALLEQPQPIKKPLLLEKKRPEQDQPNYREHNRRKY